jgi:hypothetical protein
MTSDEMYEFILSVKELRIKQKEYFATRSPTALIESKILEKKMDAKVRILMNNLKPTPPKLF